MRKQVDWDTIRAQQWDRMVEIKKLRDQGLTLKAIGHLEGRSPERMRQLLFKFERSSKLYSTKHNYVHLIRIKRNDTDHNSAVGNG